MATALNMACPLPLTYTDRVLLGHGSGGKLSAALLSDVFLRVFDSPVLASMEDQDRKSVV